MARTGPEREPAVRLTDASVRLGGREVWSNVNVTITQGQFVALLGPNGAGKTTLLRVLLGETKLSGGRASVLGGDPGQANPRIGYLPQRRHFDAATRIRGVDLVRLGLDGMRWGLPLRRGGRQRVLEAVEQVGATEYARRPIGSLSGGEQQRLLIAQALVSDPQLLTLDEPLDSLDLPTQRSVAALVQRICREREVTVVLVAHDINPLLSYLDSAIYLAGGRALSGSPEEVITTPTLSALYGVPIEVLRTSDGRLVVVGQPDQTPAHGTLHDHE